MNKFFLLTLLSVAPMAFAAAEAKPAADTATVKADDKAKDAKPAADAKKADDKAKVDDAKVQAEALVKQHEDELAKAEENEKKDPSAENKTITIKAKEKLQYSKEALAKLTPEKGYLESIKASVSAQTEKLAKLISENPWIATAVIVATTVAVVEAVHAYCASGEAEDNNF